MELFIIRRLRQEVNQMWCRHSSVDLSAPSILLPRVRVPRTPSTLFSIYIVQIPYLSLELECKKNENKQKETHLKKKSIKFSYCPLLIASIYLVFHKHNSLSHGPIRTFISFIELFSRKGWSLPKLAKVVKLFCCVHLLLLRSSMIPN